MEDLIEKAFEYRELLGDEQYELADLGTIAARRCGAVRAAAKSGDGLGIF